MSATWKYRQELTKNADSIIKFNQSSLCIEHPTFTKVNNKYHGPYKYSCCDDDSRPIGYKESDLKNAYVNRQKIICKTITPEFNNNISHSAENHF